MAELGGLRITVESHGGDREDEVHVINTCTRDALTCWQKTSADIPVVFDRRTGTSPTHPHLRVRHPELLRIEKIILQNSIQEAQQYIGWHNKEIADLHRRILYRQRQEASLRKRLEALPEQVEDIPPSAVHSKCEKVNPLEKMGYTGGGVFDD